MASSKESLYLPDDCWILIFKLVTEGCDDREYSRYLKSLSSISKQLLSITNNFRFSLTIYKAKLPIRHLFKRFPNLTSLNLSRCYTTDIPNVYHELNALLFKISRLPLKLTSLNISNKAIIPGRGLRALSQNITTLTSLTFSNIFSVKSTDMFLIADCFPLLEELDLSQRERLTDIVGGVEALSSALFKLRRVDLSGHEYIKDELLLHLFKNCKLLEEAIMFRCRQLTKAGIASALLMSPTLRSLSFTGYYEIDEHALFSEFIRNCPSLTEIKVEYQCERIRNVGYPNLAMNFVLNPQLKSLSLVSNRWLTNEKMETFASSFPNLEMLDLSSSHNIHEEGICEVLQRCSKIRHLNLSDCPIVKLRNMNFEVLELEVLNLSHTRVDDEGLRVISKSCCGLLQLLLESCWDVTEKGLKHVVENCKQLREINLKNCLRVHGDVVVSMVFSRPSLRKIIAPPCYSFTDKKWEYFGLCMIIA